MKKAILLRSLLATALLFSGLSTAALAKDGTSGSTSGSTTTSGSTSTGSHSETETNPTSTGTQTETESSSQPETENQIEVERHTLEQEVQKMHQDAKIEEKLDDSKKRQCDKVAADIDQHAQSFITHANNQLQVFDSISQKVQDFAKSKNLTVAAQSSLLTQITASRAKVLQDITTLKADAAAFKCDGANPKGALKAFHSDAALVRSDLKAYRSLVRQLIQAVRQANGQASPKTTDAKPEDQTNPGVTNATHQ